MHVNEMNPQCHAHPFDRRLGLFDYICPDTGIAPRQYALMFGPGIGQVSCFASNYFGVPRYQWCKALPLRYLVLHETRKIQAYRRLGYLSEVQVIDRRFRLYLSVFRFARHLVADGTQCGRFF